MGSAARMGGLHHGGDAPPGAASPAAPSAQLALVEDCGTVPAVLRQLMLLAPSDHAGLELLLGRTRDRLTNGELNGSVDDLAELVFALSELKTPDRNVIVADILREVGEIAMQHADQLSPSSLPRLAYGFMCCGIRNIPLMSVIAAEVVHKIKHLGERELAYVARAFAEHSLWNDQLVNEILDQSAHHMASFSPESLTDITWALAQWSAHKPRFVALVADQVQAKIKDFTPTQLAHVGFAFASLPRHMQQTTRQLMTCIGDEAMLKLHLCSSGDLTDLTWAFVNVGMSQSHQALMSGIATMAQRKLHNFLAADIARMTWLFAWGCLQHKPFMTSVGDMVASSMNQYDPTQLSTIAWSLGYLSVRHNEFLTVLCGNVHQALAQQQQRPHGSGPHFGAPQLSNVAFACATAGQMDVELLQLAAPHIIRDIKDLKYTSLCRCAWAYRRLSAPCSKLIDAIVTEAEVKVGEFTTKALSVLVDQVCCSPLMLSNGTTHPLHEALNARTDAVAAMLVDKLRPGHVPEDYSAQLRAQNFSSCGHAGTPVLCKKLDMPLPGRDFVRRCRNRTQLWRGEGMDAHTGELPCRYAVAEVEVSCDRGERPVCRRVLRHDGDASDWQGGGGQWLQPVELPGGPGRSIALFAVLLEVCALLASAGVDFESWESRAAVTGTVDVFSTAVPDISCIGAMRQFTLLFENLALCFAEQVHADTNDMDSV